MPTKRDTSDIVPVAEQPSIHARHTAGRAHMGQVIHWWATRSNLSYRQLGAIADWATHETDILRSSTLAHLRNSNLRQPGLRIFEALTAANQAIDDWQQLGSTYCAKRYGPIDATVTPQELSSAMVVQNPDTSEPLSFTDWLRLFTGRIQIPNADTITVSPAQAEGASEKLLTMIEEAIAPKALAPRAALEAIMAAYQPEDKNRRARIRDWLVRGTILSPDTIEEELPDLAATIATLRGDDPDAYGEAELWQDLIKDRRRT